MAVIVYAIPHQDDETLAMGASIRRHIEAGHDVHMLLMTSGINSAVRLSTGLNRPQFTAARDDEMRRACCRLGAPSGNVHISRHSTEDGKLTAAAADDVLRAFLDAYPGAWVKTYSNLPADGRHADHCNAGQAAVNLAAAGQITNLRLYIEPWLRDKFRTAHPNVPLMADRAAGAGAVLAALDEYRVRGGGRHGIGYRSVPDAFDLVRAERTSYCHVPV